MKIRFCFLSLLIFFLIQTAIAATCTSDVLIEMRDQVEQYGSITTTDGIQLTSINRILREDGGMCSGYGYYHEDFRGKMFWEKGNWRNTLHHA